MAKVTLVSPRGVEVQVDSTKSFVQLVYGENYDPKTGSIDDNWKTLRGVAGPPAPDPQRPVTVADLAAGSTSAATAALRAGYVPRWTAATQFTANDIVLSPTGALVQAKANFTSSSTYDATKWTVLSGATPAPLTVAAAVSTAGTLTAGALTPVDASSAAIEMILPTSTSGRLIAVEKSDTSSNAITLTGSIRSVPNSSIQLVLTREVLLLVSDSDGSWWPLSDRKTLSSLDARYVQSPGVTIQQSGNLGATQTLDGTAAPETWLAGTLSANLTVTLSNLTAGKRARLLLTQDATGGRTLTVSMGAGSQPVTIASPAGAVSVVSIYTPDGSSLFIEVSGQTAPSGYTRFHSAGIGWQTAETLANGLRTTGLVFNTLVASPLYSGPSGTTISRVSINVATAAAAEVYRVGIWKITDQTDPLHWVAGTKWADLLLDVGLQATLPMSATGGNSLILTTPLVIPPNTWFAIGGVAQGTDGSGQLSIGSATSGIFSPLGSNGNSISGASVGAFLGLAQTATAGALGNFVPTSGSAVGHGVGFLRAA